MTLELVCEGCVGVYEIDEERGRGSWSLEDILGCCATMSPWVHAQGSRKFCELRFRTGNTFRMVERKVHRGNVRKES